MTWLAEFKDIFVLLAMGKFHNRTLWAKPTFCRIETKSMFIYTRISAPKRFAKFGWQTRTICHKVNEKAVAKLESDRLYSNGNFRQTCKGNDFS